MKKLVTLLSIALLSCNGPHKKTRQATIVDPTQQATVSQTDATTQTGSKAGNSKHHITTDTAVISTGTGDTFKYTKDEFNLIIDNHPEFFDDFVRDPDCTYNCHANDKAFNCEAGQDDYYVLYGYFLKQKNGAGKYTQQRQKLITIYTCINSLFSRIQHGGTYFDHQSIRISGYAEYSVYLLPKTKNEIEKTYDITKQKALYIQSLRQLIADENKIDFSVSAAEKVETAKELNNIIDNLDKLITDNFYLRRAQEFHYGHYEYY